MTAPTRRPRLSQVVLRYLTLDPLPEEHAAGYQAYVAETMRPIARALFALTAIVTLLWWPADPVVFGGDPATLRVLSLWRIAFTVGALAIVIALDHVSARRLGLAVCVSFVTMSAGSFYAFGLVEGLDSPMIQSAIALPGYSMFVLVGPWARVVLLATLLLANWGAYLSAAQDFAGYPHLRLIVSTSGASAVIAWGIGHAAYYLVRARYVEACELARSRERFRLVTSAMRDVVYEWDLRQDVVWVSHVGGEQATRPEQAGRPMSAEEWKALVHPDEREAVIADLERALRAPGCDRWSAAYRALHGKHEVRSVLNRGYVVRNDLGVPLRLVGVVEDQTEQSLWDQRLRHLAAASGPEPMPIATLLERTATALGMHEALLVRLPGQEGGEAVVVAAAELVRGWLPPERVARSGLLAAVGSAGRLVCADRLADRHPAETWAERKGVQSFAGVHVTTAATGRAWVVCVVGREPLDHAERALAVLELVAHRIAAEQALAELARTLHEPSAGTAPERGT